MLFYEEPTQNCKVFPLQDRLISGVCWFCVIFWDEAPCPARSGDLWPRGGDGERPLSAPEPGPLRRPRFAPSHHRGWVIADGGEQT